MIENARKKIMDEMSKEKSPYIQVIGNYLLRYLEQNPGVAAAILNQEKSIKQSMEEMKRVAEKNKVGNCAVLTDEEGFAVVLKYFGIQEEPGRQSASARSLSSKRETEINFDVKLEDLL